MLLFDLQVLLMQPMTLFAAISGGAGGRVSAVSTFTALSVCTVTTVRPVPLFNPSSVARQ